MFILSLRFGGNGGAQDFGSTSSPMPESVNTSEFLSQFGNCSWLLDCRKKKQQIHCFVFVDSRSANFLEIRKTIPVQNAKTITKNILKP